jgi:alkylated DNA repair dioxygenase AlkB
VAIEGQPSLFDSDNDGTPIVERLDLEDGDVTYYRNFFPSHDRDRLLPQVTETTAWQQETLRMYGKAIPVPRLTAWHGEPNCVYTYSNITMEPAPWTDALLEIKARIEPEAGSVFNSVLINLYRHGRDGVAWHSDDEPELGPAPVIASVSFGATRKFQLRHVTNSGLRHELELEHGSLLMMRGSTQRYWRHQVPKTSRAVGPRVNLTFRVIS